MLTTDQIILLAFLGFWMLVSILAYVLLLRYTREEYKKFYPHPIVNIVKDINSGNRFKFWEKLLIFTCLNIVYLPIICEWLIAWCLYKFWKFIYVDDTAEQKIEEEIKNQSSDAIKEEEKVEQDKANLHADQMKKDLENPEYISKDEKSEDYFTSKEFLNYLCNNNNKNSGIIEYGIDLAQTPDTEINKVEDVKNISIMNNEDEPKVEQEVKPKRKYTRKKPVNDSAENKEVNTNNKAENN